jgi:hypothetical protein
VFKCPGVPIIQARFSVVNNAKGAPLSDLDCVCVLGGEGASGGASGSSLRSFDGKKG